MKTLRKDNVTIHVIQSADEAQKLVDYVQRHASEKNVFGLDLETTSLMPKDGKCRITSIAVSKSKVFVVDHFKSIPFKDFAEGVMDVGPYFVFNGNFEGRWFDYTTDCETFNPWDVGHMRRSVEGGGPLSLASMAKMDLKITLEKEEQLSDWSAPNLTDSQYIYAGYDAAVTKELGDLWTGKMNAGHWNGFHTINDAWRAVNECYDTGMLIDVDYHKTLISMWTKRRDAAEASVKKLIGNQIKNIRSKKQISDFIKTLLDADSIENWPKTDKTAQLQTDRKTLRSMSYMSPYPFSRFLAGLMVFNRADKYLSTYGETLLTKQMLSEDGRVHGRLNMAAAVTGRFSSSNPNLQNIPRSPVVRRSFISGTGKKMVLADYSGIEVRVLAEMSGDKVLLHDAIYGDVHAQSAIVIYKENEEEFLKLLKKKDPRAKEKRSKAKGFTFQLTYGAGTGALAIVLRTSIDGAAAAVSAWAGRYSKAYQLRHYMAEKMNHNGYLPCASGRTIYVPKRERSLPIASNYPIQGSAGDVMYRAMYHVRKMIVEQGINAWLMVSVHDELLLLADDDEDTCNQAAVILEEGMRRGWLDVFPDTNTDNLLEAVIGTSWADKA